METLKQIMYGVTDFALMRRENAYFVDRTACLRELEKTRYALFLRPRRFGKSLICAILRAYYDIDYADRFEELFGGLDIGRDPTSEHGQYLTLAFNFSMVEKTFENVQESFNLHCSLVIDEFVRRHVGLLPEGIAEAVYAQTSCSAKLNVLFARLQGWKRKLFVIIDEYDNFTNTILSESRDNYERLCHGEGFFKQFFNEFKGMTTGVDSPLARMFITGVTPVTMDDVTSGFNIAANISLNPAFATFAGFTHDDLRTMLAYYRANAGFEFDTDAVFETMRRWYDNYCFSPEAADGERVANPTLVLYYMQYFLQNHRPEPDLVDLNLRTDYMKIRHIVTEGRKINGNYHRLEDILVKLGATATLCKSFQARELGTADNFVSFLFYNGLVTIVGDRMGRTKLGIPNLTVGEFMHDFVPRAYQDVSGVDSPVQDIGNAMADFAETGDWRPAVDTACAVVSRYWKVRDAIEGERVVQTALCALLYVGHGPYIVTHELEANGGYTDIVFEPQLGRWPDIGHAAILELKYLKESDDASPAALAKLRADVADQLARYAADRDLARQWNLREQGGTVTLHRIVLVFHGGQVALCAEI